MKYQLVKSIPSITTALINCTSKKVMVKASVPFLVRQPIITSKSRTIASQATMPRNIEEHIPPFHIEETSQQIFKKVWSKFTEEVGEHNVKIPNEILWLIGAPGSGKGTVTEQLLNQIKTVNPPLCMSSLLSSKPMRDLIDQGRMIDDGIVLEHLLHHLQDRDHKLPIIIDGFPRTAVQAQLLILLKQKMDDLFLYKAKFQLVILLVSKETSLTRQLARGMNAKLHNAKVRLTGVGNLMEERSTDYNQQLVINRYDLFQQHLQPILNLASLLPFHNVDADCEVKKVVDRLVQIYDRTYIKDSERINLSVNLSRKWITFKNQKRDLPIIDSQDKLQAIA